MEPWKKAMLDNQLHRISTNIHYMKKLKDCSLQQHIEQQELELFKIKQELKHYT